MGILKVGYSNVGGYIMCVSCLPNFGFGAMSHHCTQFIAQVVLLGTGYIHTYYVTAILVISSYCN